MKEDKAFTDQEPMPSEGAGTEPEPAKRVPVPPKMRFDVFKRDSFTCQYCGKRAPDVVLECDHIEPVANGGKTEILNLITGCFECNRGKGATPLSDHAVLAKQRDMLDQLEERRWQIEMMLRWRDSLQAQKTKTLDEIVERIADAGGWYPNESAMADIKKWLRKYTVAEILAAADESFSIYLEYRPSEKGPTIESFSKAFRKIGNLLSLQKQAEEKPYIQRLAYIQGIIRVRSRNKYYRCIDYLEHLHLCGFDLDTMERRAKESRSIEDFEGPYDAALAKMGKSY